MRTNNATTHPVNKKIGTGTMGHESYADLLTRLVDARDYQYRTDPERNEARLQSLESIVQSMLEKLRDAFEPH